MILLFDCLYVLILYWVKFEKFLRNRRGYGRANQRLSWYFQIGSTVMNNKNDRYIFTLKNILCLLASFAMKQTGEYFYDENPMVICAVHKSFLSDLICLSKAWGNENATTGSKMLFYAILLYVIYICRT